MKKLGYTYATKAGLSISVSDFHTPPEKEQIVKRAFAQAKEISKQHENIQRGTLSGLLDWLHSDKDLSKGEFVVVVQGDKTSKFDTQEASRILKILLVDHSVKQAARLTSEIMQGNRNDIYKLAMDLKD